jgi:hypothetical protein
VVGWTQQARAQSDGGDGLGWTSRQGRSGAERAGKGAQTARWAGRAGKGARAVGWTSRQGRSGGGSRGRGSAKKVRNRLALGRRQDRRNLTLLGAAAGDARQRRVAGQRRACACQCFCARCSRGWTGDGRGEAAAGAWLRSAPRRTQTVLGEGQRRRTGWSGGFADEARLNKYRVVRERGLAELGSTGMDGIISPRWHAGDGGGVPGAGRSERRSGRLTPSRDWTVGRASEAVGGELTDEGASNIAS